VLFLHIPIVSVFVAGKVRQNSGIISEIIVPWNCGTASKNLLNG
jgi:hypothetical protein